MFERKSSMAKDKSKEKWRSDIPCTKCKKGCIRPRCSFMHPADWRIPDCKFGDNCANVKCKYVHKGAFV